MIRRLACLALISATPAAAQEGCTALSDAVSFCPGATPWAAFEAQEREDGGYAWEGGELLLQAFPLEDGLYEGTQPPGSRARDIILTDYATRTGGVIQGRAVPLGEDGPATTAAIAYPDGDTSALVTLYGLEGETWFVVTNELGTEVTSVHQRGHMAALQSLTGEEPS
ncbi:hypothetical protein [Histidinibacterium aquaticum]|uniref:Uncharacterized protein n=1 Tax=Histidinibacterium aquaticum TaxID=2613962 RepID=A0A5J5GLG4_9RHOB|nr:hypothetical protein [Histidinibacterium aquaticum]KAA9009196.1 hypothetical protein F3S47_08050 [Histidinibacterium aquaticum]